jgi:uncharacterized OsmC-like protein
MPVRTETLEASAARFRSDPGAAVTEVIVTAELDEDLGRIQAGPFSWLTDLGPAMGGANAAPSPTAYLLGALAGCAVVFIRDTLAPQLGVTIDDVRAQVRCRSDLRGLLAIDAASPALQGIRLDIEIRSPDAQERIEALHQAWLQRCPIYLALQNASGVDVRLALVGTADRGRSTS